MKSNKKYQYAINVPSILPKCTVTQHFSIKTHTLQPQPRVQVQIIHYVLIEGYINMSKKLKCSQIKKKRKKEKKKKKKGKKEEDDGE